MQPPGRGNSQKSPLLSFGDFSGATLQAMHQDATFFPSAQTSENVAILHACLSTNLLMRGLKIFSSLRDASASRIESSDLAGIGPDGEAPIALRQKWASSSILGRSSYAAVFSAMFRRAVNEPRSSDTLAWIERAWNLFKEMEIGKKRVPGVSALPHSHTMDPLPDELIVAVMAKGLIACIQSDSQVSTEKASLSDLVAYAWRAGLSFDAILHQCATQAFTTEDKGALGKIDARAVAHAMAAAAVQSGHELARLAVDAAEQRMQSPTDAQDADLEGKEGVEDFPELRPVKATAKALKLTKGKAEPEDDRPLNLSLLQRELSVVRQARKTMRDHDERQRLLEETALDSARLRLETTSDRLEQIGLRTKGAVSTDGQLQKWMWEWTQKLEKTLAKDLERLVKQRSELAADEAARDLAVLGGPRKDEEDQIESSILPYLLLVSPARLALLTVLEIIRNLGSLGVGKGMRMTRALISLGVAVEQEHYAQVLHDHPEIAAERRRTSDEVKRFGPLDLNSRRKAKEWLRKRAESHAVAGEGKDWTLMVRARIGGYLLNHLIKVATIQRHAIGRDGEVWAEQDPALFATYQYMQGKKAGVIRLSEQVASRIDRDSLSSTLLPRYLPMLVKPCSWLSHDQGGYLVSKSTMMRYKDSLEQLSYLKAASDAGNLEVVMSGLDVLGDTPWIINRKVLAVVTDVWNSGEEVADIPGLREPEAWKEKLKRPADFDSNMASRARFAAQERLVRSEHAANHSQRCNVNYKLEIARAFLGETFYFPHNIDFRGRAYPIPAHLNHIGDDLCRGLLKFAKGKPLGKNGMRWLRIHLANVYGFDKANFDEREQFAINHTDDIVDAVNNPLDGKRWWLGADDPWQCLATCHEIVDALNCPEGLENFESRMPIHQDGTCNGLQHYAALGGDMAGAKQVNLSNGERPSDVYTAVADLVIDRLEQDYWKAKDEERESSLAAILRGKVTRKVVKQTVMTKVYGVTFIGAKAQVQKQLVDRGDIPAEHVFKAATYLARLVLDSVQDLFTGAELIQNWLTESAGLIARSIPPDRAAYLMNEEVQGAEAKAPKKGKRSTETEPFAVRARSRLLKEQMTSVIWTTPLSLPVVQPYRRSNKRQIATAMQTIFLKDVRVNTEVSPGKQASAFPPNFIHSLDATHMILTALECQQAGLTFAAVHDSYWTHACDVETMSELIRDCFVRLHSADILPKLRAEFQERYRGYKVPVVVAKDLLKKREGPVPEDLQAKFDAAEEAAQSRKGRKAKEDSGEEGKKTKRKTKTKKSAAKTADEESGSVEAGSIVSAAAESANEADSLSEDGFGDDSDAVREIDTKQAPSGIAKNAVVMDSKDAEKILGKEAAADATEALVNTRFVDVTDLLPDLPAKGSFDVNEIKLSKYFFS